MTAGPIADIPIIEITNPSIHLGRGNLFRHLDHARQNPRIVHTTGPKIQSQLVVSSDSPRECVHLWFCHAINDFRANAESSHTVNVSPLTQSAQFFQGLGTSPGASSASLEETVLNMCCQSRQ